jgi:hypothetical protein
MPVLTTAIMNLIVILLIGIVVGVGFRRYGRAWMRSNTAGLTVPSDVTYALVGIAGSFTGFHIFVILGLLPTPLMLYVGAVIGSVLTVWLWRGR